jgi:hypothetical protein
MNLIQVSRIEMFSYRKYELSIDHSLFYTGLDLLSFKSLCVIVLVLSVVVGGGEP